MTAPVSHRLTPKKKDLFVEALASTGNVRKAAEIIGFATHTVYAHRKLDPLFALAWDDALQSAMDTVLEVEAIRRAVDGVEQDVYYQGEKVGSKREYSDTLLIFLLKGWKSDRYKDRSEIFHAGTIALLRKLERIGSMSPDELQAFLQDVEQHVNALESRA